ncbi:MAG: EamA family transporter [Rhodobacteraceae bacterium]|nr:EamA family transporter [Paracoccaceae bacterium]
MSSQKSFTPRAWAELGLLALVWGATFLSVRIALDEIPVLTIVLHRTCWAALALWIWVAWRGFDVPKDPRTWAAFAVMGLLNNVLPFGLMAWGQLTIESGLTAILNATTALFGVLVAAIFFSDERLSARKLSGVMLGLTGVVLAIGPDALNGLDLRSLAQLAVIGGTLSYAFAGAWGRIHLSGLRPEVAAAGMLTAASLLLLPIVLVIDGPPSMDLTGRTWGALGYGSICGTAVAYLLYYRGLAAVGAGNLLIVTLMIPPIAIILGAVILDETLPARAYAGFVLLALGLMVVNGRMPRLLAPRKRPRTG